MKAAHDELQVSVAAFMEKDAEIKKLFDMFEKALKTISEENTELKEKLETAEKENGSLKGMILEYQKDLGNAKEQISRAAKVMEQFQAQKTQVQPRVSSNTESTFGRRSEPAITDARPSSYRPKEAPKSVKTSHQHVVDSKFASEYADIERIDEEEDQESSQSTQHQLAVSSKHSSHRDHMARQSHDLTFLRESNKLLKKQNENLKIQTRLIEEKSKKEKDDFGKVGL